MVSREARIVKRRIFDVALCAMFLALSLPASAQQQLAKIPRIGVVAASRPNPTPSPTIDGFRRGLRDLGYVEGKNVVVEYRYAEGNQRLVPEFIAEFVRLNVDAIVVGSSAGIRSAKEATKTIPIVMVSVVDPVAAGTVESLARPGGNITGLAILTRELSGKRLEILKEILPNVRHIGVLWHKESPSSIVGFKEYQAVAEPLKVQLHSIEVLGLNPDFGPAFEDAVKRRITSVVVIGSPVLNAHPKQIAELALTHRLPSIYERKRFIEAGGLASYGSNEIEDWRRVAFYVDKILKGVKPANLPVEQPTKFEFVINLKAAKQIGLTIPPNVLARADKVIR